MMLNNFGDTNTTAYSNNGNNSNSNNHVHDTSIKDPSVLPQRATVQAIEQIQSSKQSSAGSASAAAHIAAPPPPPPSWGPYAAHHQLDGFLNGCYSANNHHQSVYTAIDQYKSNNNKYHTASHPIQHDYHYPTQYTSGTLHHPIPVTPKCNDVCCQHLADPPRYPAHLNPATFQFPPHHIQPPRYSEYHHATTNSVPKQYLCNKKNKAISSSSASSSNSGFSPVHPDFHTIQKYGHHHHHHHHPHHHSGRQKNELKQPAKPVALETHHYPVYPYWTSRGWIPPPPAYHQAVPLPPQYKAKHDSAGNIHCTTAFQPIDHNVNLPTPSNHANQERKGVIMNSSNTNSSNIHSSNTSIGGITKTINDYHEKAPTYRPDCFDLSTSFINSGFPPIVHNSTNKITINNITTPLPPPQTSASVSHSQPQNNLPCQLMNIDKSQQQIGVQSELQFSINETSNVGQDASPPAHCINVLSTSSPHNSNYMINESVNCNPINYSITNNDICSGNSNSNNNNNNRSSNNPASVVRNSFQNNSHVNNPNKCLQQPSVSKKQPNLDVRQFLLTWNDADEDNTRSETQSNSAPSNIASDCSNKVTAEEDRINPSTPVNKCNSPWTNSPLQPGHHQHAHNPVAKSNTGSNSELIVDSHALPRNSDNPHKYDINNRILFNKEINDGNSSISSSSNVVDCPPMMSRSLLQNHDESHRFPYVNVDGYNNPKVITGDDKMMPENNHIGIYPPDKSHFPLYNGFSNWSRDDKYKNDNRNVIENHRAFYNNFNEPPTPPQHSCNAVRPRCSSWDHPNHSSNNNNSNNHIQPTSPNVPTGHTLVPSVQKKSNVNIVEPIIPPRNSTIFHNNDQRSNFRPNDVADESLVRFYNTNIQTSAIQPRSVIDSSCGFIDLTNGKRIVENDCPPLNSNSNNNVQTHDNQQDRPFVSYKTGVICENNNVTKCMLNTPTPKFNDNVLHIPKPAISKICDPVNNSSSNNTNNEKNLESVNNDPGNNSVVSPETLFPNTFVSVDEEDSDDDDSDDDNENNDVIGGDKNENMLISSVNSNSNNYVDVVSNNTPENLNLDTLSVPVVNCNSPQVNSSSSSSSNNYSQPNSNLNMPCSNIVEPLLRNPISVSSPASNSSNNNNSSRSGNVTQEKHDPVCENSTIFINRIPSGSESLLNTFTNNSENVKDNCDNTITLHSADDCSGINITRIAVNECSPYVQHYSDVEASLTQNMLKSNSNTSGDNYTKENDDVNKNNDSSTSSAVTTVDMSKSTSIHKDQLQHKNSLSKSDLIKMKLNKRIIKKRMAPSLKLKRLPNSKNWVNIEEHSSKSMSADCTVSNNSFDSEREFKRNESEHLIPRHQDASLSPLVENHGNTCFSGTINTVVNSPSSCKEQKRITRALSMPSLEDSPCSHEIDNELEELISEQSEKHNFNGEIGNNTNYFNNHEDLQNKNIHEVLVKHSNVENFGDVNEHNVMSTRNDVLHNNSSNSDISNSLEPCFSNNKSSTNNFVPKTSENNCVIGGLNSDCNPKIIPDAVVSNTNDCSNSSERNCSNFKESHVDNQGSNIAFVNSPSISYFKMNKNKKDSIEDHHCNELDDNIDYDEERLISSVECTPGSPNVEELFEDINKTTVIEHFNKPDYHQSQLDNEAIVTTPKSIDESNQFQSKIHCNLVDVSLNVSNLNSCKIKSKQESVIKSTLTTDDSDNNFHCNISSVNSFGHQPCFKNNSSSVSNISNVCSLSSPFHTLDNIVNTTSSSYNLPTSFQDNLKVMRDTDKEQSSNLAVNEIDKSVESNNIDIESLCNISALSSSHHDNIDTNEKPECHVDSPPSDTSDIISHLDAIDLSKDVSKTDEGVQPSAVDAPKTETIENLKLDELHPQARVPLCLTDMSDSDKEMSQYEIDVSRMEGEMSRCIPDISLSDDVHNKKENGKTESLHLETDTLQNNSISHQEGVIECGNSESQNNNAENKSSNTFNEVKNNDLEKLDVPIDIQPLASVCKKIVNLSTKSSISELLVNSSKDEQDFVIVRRSSIDEIEEEQEEETEEFTFDNPAEKTSKYDLDFTFTRRSSIDEEENNYGSSKRNLSKYEEEFVITRRSSVEELSSSDSSSEDDHDDDNEKLNESTVINLVKADEECAVDIVKLDNIDKDKSTDGEVQANLETLGESKSVVVTDGVIANDRDSSEEQQKDNSIEQQEDSELDISDKSPVDVHNCSSNISCSTDKKDKIFENNLKLTEVDGLPIDDENSSSKNNAKFKPFEESIKDSFEKDEEINKNDDNSDDDTSINCKDDYIDKYAKLMSAIQDDCVTINKSESQTTLVTDSCTLSIEPSEIVGDSFQANMAESESCNDTEEIISDKSSLCNEDSDNDSIENNKSSVSDDESVEIKTKNCFYENYTHETRTSEDVNKSHDSSLEKFENNEQNQVVRSSKIDEEHGSEIYDTSVSSCSSPSSSSSSSSTEDLQENFTDDILSEVRSTDTDSCVVQSDVRSVEVSENLLVSEKSDTLVSNSEIDEEQLNNNNNCSDKIKLLNNHCKNCKKNIECNYKLLEKQNLRKENVNEQSILDLQMCNDCDLNMHEQSNNNVAAIDLCTNKVNSGKLSTLEDENFESPGSECNEGYNTEIDNDSSGNYEIIDTCSDDYNDYDNDLNVHSTCDNVDPLRIDEKEKEFGSNGIKTSQELAPEIHVVEYDKKISERVEDDNKLITSESLNIVNDDCESVSNLSVPETKESHDDKRTVDSVEVGSDKEDGNCDETGVLHETLMSPNVINDASESQKADESNTQINVDNTKTDLVLNEEVMEESSSDEDSRSANNKSEDSESVQSDVCSSNDCNTNCHSCGEKSPNRISDDESTDISLHTTLTNEDNGNTYNYKTSHGVVETTETVEDDNASIVNDNNSDTNDNEEKEVSNCNNDLTIKHDTVFNTEVSVLNKTNLNLSDNNLLPSNNSTKFYLKNNEELLENSNSVSLETSLTGVKSCNFDNLNSNNDSCSIKPVIKLKHIKNCQVKTKDKISNNTNLLCSKNNSIERRKQSKLFLFKKQLFLRNRIRLKKSINKLFIEKHKNYLIKKYFTKRKFGKHFKRFSYNSNSVMSSTVSCSLSSNLGESKFIKNNKKRKHFPRNNNIQIKFKLAPDLTNPVSALEENKSNDILDNEQNSEEDPDCLLPDKKSVKEETINLSSTKYLPETDILQSNEVTESDSKVDCTKSTTLNIDSEFIDCNFIKDPENTSECLKESISTVIKQSSINVGEFSCSGKRELTDKFLALRFRNKVNLNQKLKNKRKQNLIKQSIKKINNKKSVNNLSMVKRNNNSFGRRKAFTSNLVDSKIINRKNFKSVTKDSKQKGVDDNSNDVTSSTEITNSEFSVTEKLMTQHNGEFSDSSNSGNAFESNNDGCFDSEENDDSISTTTNNICLFKKNDNYSGKSFDDCNNLLTETESVVISEILKYGSLNENDNLIITNENIIKVNNNNNESLQKDDDCNINNSKNNLVSKVPIINLDNSDSIVIIIEELCNSQDKLFHVNVEDNNDNDSLSYKSPANIDDKEERIENRIIEDVCTEEVIERNEKIDVVEAAKEFVANVIDDFSVAEVEVGYNYESEASHQGDNIENTERLDYNHSHHDDDTDHYKNDDAHRIADDDVDKSILCMRQNLHQSTICSDDEADINNYENDTLKHDSEKRLDEEDRINKSSCTSMFKPIKDVATSPFVLNRDDEKFDTNDGETVKNIPGDNNNYFDIVRISPTVNKENDLSISENRSEKPVIKCSLPWERVFNTSHSRKRKISSKKSTHNSSSGIELGPAKIEFRMGSAVNSDETGGHDTCWKVVGNNLPSINNINVSPVVKVKRLILQRDPELTSYSEDSGSSSKESNSSSEEDNSNKHVGTKQISTPTQSPSSSDKEKDTDGEGSCSDSDKSSTIPKVLIKKMKQSEYKSFLKLPDKFNKPVVKIIRSNMIDNLALKNQVSINVLPKNNVDKTSDPKVNNTLLENFVIKKFPSPWIPSKDISVTSHMDSDCSVQKNISDSQDEEMSVENNSEKDNDCFIVEDSEHDENLNNNKLKVIPNRLLYNCSPALPIFPPPHQHTFNATNQQSPLQNNCDNYNYDDSDISSIISKNIRNEIDNEVERINTFSSASSVTSNYASISSVTQNNSSSNNNNKRNQSDSLINNNNNSNYSDSMYSCDTKQNNEDDVSNGVVKEQDKSNDTDHRSEESSKKRRPRGTKRPADESSSNGTDSAVKKRSTKNVSKYMFHCQRCLLVFNNKEEVMNHQTMMHPSHQELHHCMLCQRSFSSLTRHTLHIQSRSHRRLELLQRCTIHAMHRFFTGRDCPRLYPLTPAELKSFDWRPNQPGCIHFYHHPSPLQLALQENPWGMKSKAGAEQLSPSSSSSSSDSSSSAASSPTPIPRSPSPSEIPSSRWSHSSYDNHNNDNDDDGFLKR